MPRGQDYRYHRLADCLAPPTQTGMPLPIASRGGRWAVIHRPRTQSVAVKGSPFRTPQLPHAMGKSPRAIISVCYKSLPTAALRGRQLRATFHFRSVPSCIVVCQPKPSDRPASDGWNPRPRAITWRCLKASGGAQLLLSRPSRPARRMETQAIAPPPPPLNGGFSAPTTVPHSLKSAKGCARDEGGNGGGQQGSHVDVGDQRGARGGDAGSGSMVSEGGRFTVRGL